tara:strand:- start:888 stop:1547 length:660 start_codon:yes stop_codon:yes gene_type:complete
MFTGLIQSVGKVSRQGNSFRVDGCEPFGPLRIGDSISVDGVCLTVSSFSHNGFLADVSEETLKRTTLGTKANINGFVNLEPALRLSDRLGGHLVSGHIDGLGEVLSIKELSNSWNLKVRWNNPRYGRYLCDKGSICLNGISLTISELFNDGISFSMAIIPHTWISTSLQYLSLGEVVNLEADLMAKYAERLLSMNNSSQDDNFEANQITKIWLENQGWK